jgi:hypothetical protein
MNPDCRALLPADKFDIERARATIALGYPQVDTILPALLEWMKDMNWPVAQTLQPFLASIGLPLLPHVRRVFDTSDEMWKYWVVRCIVGESPELARVLEPELHRLASAPTSIEREAGLDEAAQQVLARIAM